MEILKVQDLCKTYGKGEAKVEALKKVSFSLDKGEFAAVDVYKRQEEALSKTSELMAATVDYAKTRPVFDGYKAARYSKKYLRCV